MAITPVEITWDGPDEKSADNYENWVLNHAGTDAYNLTGDNTEEFVGWIYIGHFSDVSIIITDQETQAFEAKVYGIDHDPDTTFADNRRQMLGAALAVGADGSIGEYYLGKWKYLLITCKHNGGAKTAQVAIDAYGKLRH